MVGINGPPSGVMIASTYHGETFGVAEFGGGMYSSVVSDEGVSFVIDKEFDINTVEIIPVSPSKEQCPEFV